MEIVDWPAGMNGMIIVQKGGDAAQKRWTFKMLDEQKTSFRHDLKTAQVFYMFLRFTCANCALHLLHVGFASSSNVSPAKPLDILEP